MISFVIPAYNEESILPETLRALKDSAEGSGEAYEVIVVDDDSDDGTAAVAETHGARVIHVRERKIGAVRNAGAREALGDVLVFLDADTRLPLQTLAAALAALDRGAIGGGAGIDFDGRVGWRWRFLAGTILVPMRILGWAAGCFIFVEREAFEAAGGFDERYYASEEIHLSRALKARGEFKLLRQKVITSARKLRLVRPGATLGLLLRVVLRGPRVLRNRKGLDIWYDGRLRESKRRQ